MVDNKEATIDLITKKVAKSLGKSEELVAEIQKVYWSQVKKTLGEVEKDSVRIPYLGVFYINPTSLLKRLRVLLVEMRKAKYIIRKGEFYNYHKRNELEREFRKLWQIKNQFSFREINSKTFYYHGHGYIPRFNPEYNEPTEKNKI